MPDDAVKEIITASRKGDLTSFEQLVREHQSYAYSLAMRFLADEDESNDVVQDSFMRVWKHMSRYDPDRNFRTWLYTIVTNLCLDRLRVMKRKRSLFFSNERDIDIEEVSNGHDAVSVHSNEELASIVKSLAKHLSMKQQLVFTLRDLQDLTMQEVVEITGMSMGSVKTNLHYARKSIRDILARQYGIVRADI
jgi:RNA polymerase sigma-70 factor (ECF subfamily)